MKGRKLPAWGGVAWEMLRCLVMYPFYFTIVTVFMLWPWAWRAPFALLRLLGIPESAERASALRLLMGRLAIRSDWNWRGLRAVRLGGVLGWLLRPYVESIPECWAMARLERGRSGLSRAEGLALFLRAMPDSLRYGNGYVSAFWFDPRRRARAGFHIPNELHVRVGCHLLNHVNDPSLPVERQHMDKTELYLTCRQRGWPTIPLHASFRDGRTIEYEPLGDGPLLSKPAELSQGRGGFERWVPAGRDRRGVRRYSDAEGRVVTLPELFAHLETRSLRSPYMLQPFVRPHQRIRDLSRVDTLCSLRLPTCCFPDGRVEVVAQSFFRMPLHNALMDNRSQGAVAYGVDTASGALLPGAAKGTDQVFTIHPLSQLRAVGFALPGFREAVALAVDAHGKAFPHFPTVGWDLALTDDGPMIVEMNIQWNSDHHLPNEPFIGETRYTDCVLAHLERHWPRCVPEESDSSPGAEAIATRD